MSVQHDLSSLTFHERMLAYDDLDIAKEDRRLAHWCRRTQVVGWKGEFRFHMRRARRAFRHYAEAVRKARTGRAAA